MITLYHLGVSQSERILWLLEELGLPCVLETYRREPTMLAPAALRAIHPVGALPIIRDGETVLAETGAIVEYILTRYGGGRLRADPAAPNYADYLYWLHYVNGTLMPLMMMGMLTHPAAGSDADAQQGALFRERRERHFAMIEDRLARVPYFAGTEFTAADIMMVFPFATMRSFTGIDIDGMPNLRAWLARIGARPAYQKAMKAAGHETDPIVTPPKL